MLWLITTVALVYAQSSFGATLPQKLEYQRVLRSYMSTLKESNFEHGVTTQLTVEPSSVDSDYVFSIYLLTLMQQPLVGAKRGHPAVNALARLFTLASIEGDDAILKPPVWPEALMSFVQWDSPGNPCFQNPALKRRTFVWCMNKMMVDEYMETEATSRKPEQEWRQWPVHAMSGQTKSGVVFSSARTLDPQVCRNVLIDLMANESRATSYVIATYPRQ